MHFDKTLLVSLYKTYHDGLQSLESFYAESPSIGNMYHAEERKVLYLLVRHFQPSVVVEFSPNKGWTTLHIAKALEDNGIGHIYSFEIDKEAIATAIEKIDTYNLSHRVNFFCGDVRQNLPSIIKAHPEILEDGIDLLFIDSDHSDDFAYWYLSDIFPLVKQGGLIHIHDIQIDPHAWPSRKASFPFSFPFPSLEELVVQEYLLQVKDKYDWISLRACIEDEEYLKSVQPYGGGKRAIPTNESLHWIDKLLGYQRNPSLWLYKKS